ncbi:MAG: GNAT family N-acetyltransferase [Chitinophagales bacterium]
MKVKGLGVELIRLRKEHIELLRYWRNHPDIAVFMDYQTFITEEMQMKWYKSLDVAKDFYFIIAYQNKDIGLIHVSDISWNKKSGQAGLFIWDQKYWKTQVPVFASLNLIAFAFGFLGLNKLIAKVMDNNKAAIIYNLRLGFKVFDDSPKDYSLYRLAKDDKDLLQLRSKLERLLTRNPQHFEIGRQEYSILQALPGVADQMAALIKSEALSLKN